MSKELQYKIVDLFKYHLIVWKNERGEYELKCTKQEAYKWLYEIREEIHTDERTD